MAERLKGLVSVSINPYISVGRDNQARVEDIYFKMRNAERTSNSFFNPQNFQGNPQMGGNHSDLMSLYTTVNDLSNQIRLKLNQMRPNDLQNNHNYHPNYR